MRSHFWGLKVPPHSWFVVLFGARGRSFPEPLRAASGIFEDQCAAIAERDFGWSPSGALVEALGLCAGGIPFLVESVEVQFVIFFGGVCTKNSVIHILCCPTLLLEVNDD